MSYAREEIVKLRCTPEEKARFQELARAEHTDVSTLIRRRVFAGAEEVLAASPSLFEDVPQPAAVSGTSGVYWPD